jgi:hypothetical protein
MDRDDRRGAAFDDPLESAPEGQQRAGSGDLALGKDADDLTVVQRLSRLPQRPENHAGAAGGGNGNDPHYPHQPVKERMRGIARIHHEPDPPVDRGHKQEAVHEGHMIGDQQGAAGRRHMLAADDAHAIQGVG